METNTIAPEPPSSEQRNYQDEHFQWILRIIESSMNSFHIECCKKLTDAFKDRYGTGKDLDQLYDKIIDKELSIWF